eukprot:TRINITY_DN3673_c0_g2_i5.p1 TRINITY_DN3673_c0_g2~~TRINITY_DN3673_c0_g2_i5.p1  ORF type:complete len:938 (+),score=184.41 TRINITY_DN3673_c0_g2_i5:100-2913(+)
MAVARVGSHGRLGPFDLNVARPALPMRWSANTSSGTMLGGVSRIDSPPAPGLRHMRSPTRSGISTAPTPPPSVALAFTPSLSPPAPKPSHVGMATIPSSSTLPAAPASLTVPSLGFHSNTNGNGGRSNATGSSRHRVVAKSGIRASPRVAAAPLNSVAETACTAVVGSARGSARGSRRLSAMPLPSPRAASVSVAWMVPRLSMNRVSGSSVSADPGRSEASVETAAAVDGHSVRDASINTSSISAAVAETSSSSADAPGLQDMWADKYWTHQGDEFEQLDLPQVPAPAREEEPEPSDAEPTARGPETMTAGEVLRQELLRCIHEKHHTVRQMMGEVERMKASCATLQAESERRRLMRTGIDGPNQEETDLKMLLGKMNRDTKRQEDLLAAKAAECEEFLDMYRRRGSDEKLKSWKLQLPRPVAPTAMNSALRQSAAEVQSTPDAPPSPHVLEAKQGDQEASRPVIPLLPLGTALVNATALEMLPKQEIGEYETSSSSGSDDSVFTQLTVLPGKPLPTWKREAQDSPPPCRGRSIRQTSPAPGRKAVGTSQPRQRRLVRSVSRANLRDSTSADKEEGRSRSLHLVRSASAAPVLTGGFFTAKDDNLSDAAGGVTLASVLGKTRTQEVGERRSPVHLMPRRLQGPIGVNVSTCVAAAGAAVAAVAATTKNAALTGNGSVIPSIGGIKPLLVAANPVPVRVMSPPRPGMTALSLSTRSNAGGGAAGATSPVMPPPAPVAAHGGRWGATRMAAGGPAKMQQMHQPQMQQQQQQKMQQMQVKQQPQLQQPVQQQVQQQVQHQQNPPSPQGHSLQQQQQQQSRRMASGLTTMTRNNAPNGRTYKTVTGASCRPLAPQRTRSTATFPGAAAVAAAVNSVGAEPRQTMHAPSQATRSPVRMSPPRQRQPRSPPMPSTNGPTRGTPSTTLRTTRSYYASSGGGGRK